MSKKQDFQNHAKYYPFHHFFILPLTLFFFGWTVVKIDFSSSEAISDSIYFLLLGFIILLISYLPRIYALKNQNRIIRLEMRQHYFNLTGTPFHEKENQLTSAQIIALRFAGDDEILALIDKSIKENTISKEIKKSINNWKADYHRV
ncbi:DUF6526 family protein [Algoriphagus sp. D3-2-R+10]|uniref:DUF6526 family protein n=1 Tax=Algoriphagus aurantiacus TaxID=3103948 RepID=UPI002B3B3793|nr:DUF6526 family protein [Algoriphagus sp. D3-2-R+10]MEB2775789.1 DUF6526 family protein [Algoriphagus sp. D3-2-R+10]